MWGLFVLPVSMASLMTAVAALTGSSTWMMAAVVTNDIQRRRGHHPDEGQLTRRANNHPYGVGFDLTSSYDINQRLASLAIALPEIFSSVANQRFDMTESEAEMLRAMLDPTMSALHEFILAREKAIDKEEDAELLYKAVERLTESSLVVKMWLERFPESRRVP